MNRLDIFTHWPPVRVFLNNHFVQLTLAWFSWNSNGMVAMSVCDSIKRVMEALRSVFSFPVLTFPPPWATITPRSLGSSDNAKKTLKTKNEKKSKRHIFIIGVAT